MPESFDEEAEHLLSRPSHDDIVQSHIPEGGSKMSDSTRLGLLRAYWLGVVVCMGGFLFGYDSGIVGGVLTLKSFMKDFKYSKKQQTKTNSLAVALQQAGAFAACFFIWPITHRLGRRLSLMICSTVFCIGVIIQTVNTHSLAAFYVSRVIAGLGLGGATVVVPMFSSEMAPKHLRGQIGCFFQLFYTLGIFVSYWIDYGVDVDIRNVSRQWQIPIGLQLVPGGLLGVGMLTLKESVRWYMKRGEHDKAWESLKWIRASDGPAVREEMQEIRIGIEIEVKQTEGFRITELLQKRNFSRIALAFAVFTAQQATGATAFAYFAPQYFQKLVGSDSTSSQSLLLTGIFGAVKVVACATFVFLLSERVPRRQALFWGAVFMAIFQLITAAVFKTHPPPGHNTVTSSGIATIAMIYLFVIVYNMSWGALPWPYVSEIFPTRIREPGVATGVASQWLWNFVFTLATPYMIDNISYGTFLIWGLFNVVIAVFSWFFLTETRGLALEEINSQLEGRQDLLERRLHEEGCVTSDGVLGRDDGSESEHDGKGGGQAVVNKA